MTPPVRPERPTPSDPLQQAVRLVAARYAEQGATAEEIAEILRARHPELVSTFATERAREPLDVAQRVTGSVMTGLQGASLGTGDELVGLIRGLTNDFGDRPGMTVGEGIEDTRNVLQRHREEMPGRALGAELIGGVGAGLGMAGTANASRLAPAAKVLASGAGGGAVAGYASGEGGPTSIGRLAPAAGGVALGAGLGYLGGKAAETRPVKRLLQTAGAAPAPTVPGPPVNPAVIRTLMGALGPEGNVNAARVNLDRMAPALGEDVLALNLGGDASARLGRAAANVPSFPGVRTTAKGTLDEALAKQGGQIGKRVADDIGEVTGFGTEFPEVTAKRMQTELSEKTREAFDLFRAHGELMPGQKADNLARLQTIIKNKKVAQDFLTEYVEPVIARRVTERGLTASNTTVLDDAFKDLQADVRGFTRAGQAGTRTAGDVGAKVALRDRVKASLQELDPEYIQATNAYALDEDVGKIAQRALEKGQTVRTPGAARVAMEEATVPGESKALRAGNVARLQSEARRRASNPALEEQAQFRDVARTPIGTLEDALSFEEFHGPEASKGLLERLRPKMEAQATAQAVRGNSSTARQLADMAATGSDLLSDVAVSGATGGPSGASRALLTRVFEPIKAMRAAGLGSRASELAELLTTRGVESNRTLLEYLSQFGAQEAAAKAAVKPVTGLASRTAAGRVGGR